MRRVWIVAIMAAGISVAAGVPGFAKEHRGGDRAAVSGAGLPSGFHEGMKSGWGSSKVPPGWHEGEKEGWGKGHRPPGLERR